MVRLLTVPYDVLFPAIIAFAAIGCYSLGLNQWDVAIAASALGYALIRWAASRRRSCSGSSRPLLEENLRRAMIISRGDPTVFVTRPISAFLLLVAVAALVVAALRPYGASARWSSPRR